MEMNMAVFTRQDFFDTVEQLRMEERDYEKRMTTIRIKIESLKTAFEVLSGMQLDSDAPHQAKDAPPRFQEGKEATSASTSEWAKLLKGATQLEALRRIATESGGLIRPAEAKNIFVAVGLSKGNPRNIGSHIYHILSGSPEFERIEAGLFRVVAPEV